MAETDLVLLHAPSVYDFREKPILYGPVSDMIPSTQVFEMYPIGFMTILEYLQRHGFSVRIINIALRMLKSRRFDAEKLIRSLRPAAFGLDLHWLVHAQGSLEIAAIIKKHHVDIPVIFGGLSASYYHDELIRYPQVDYVIRGDSTEEPLRLLLSAIKQGGSLENIPNLTWKNGSNVRVNELSHVPGDLDDVSFDYGNIMRSCIRHLDIRGHLPFKIWLSYPILAALSCRGCVNDCATCGGSVTAFRKTCARETPAQRSPRLLARDVASVSRYMRAPVIMLGDVLQGGERYARELLEALKSEKVRSHVAFELFRPPPEWFLDAAADAIANFNIQISPESHDEQVRRAFGRPYGNEALEKSIAHALDVGCRRIDVFFMIGIPRQTPQSVRETVQYCGKLLEMCRRAGHGGKLHPYISPLAPFLDPGSRAFEEPGKYGYRLFHRTLEEHRRALVAPSWKYTLNYETKWMSRDDLVDVTYEAAIELNRLKLEYGLVRRRAARRIAERIERERHLVREIGAVPDEGTRQGDHRETVMNFESVGRSTICGESEMNWPSGFLRFRPLRVIWETLAGRRRG
ncbi:MAG: TIGR04190 family B12-binding domain/radical SAM domain protein [Planctomycetota bacterium]